MTENVRHNARQLIANYLGVSMTEKEHRFLPSRTRLAIYHINGEFWCCPPASEGCPPDWRWEKMSEKYGRGIYCAKVPPANLI